MVKKAIQAFTPNFLTKLGALCQRSTIRLDSRQEKEEDRWTELNPSIYAVFSQSIQLYQTR
jgi:hypothetical protein